MQPSPQLHDATVHDLRHRKNLLAFSGGGDSTALFFTLLSYNIPFDIAHVNYKTRPQSDEEEAYANRLATQYSKRLFALTCTLDSSNFEHEARCARYSFFESIINEHHYDTLLTAHHLNDKLEWFLMQLTKGAGLVEMLGMSEYEQRLSYTLVRPFLHISKEALKHYLQEKEICYFEDESNASKTYLRNRFRHEIANPLLEMYTQGIRHSFEYLEKDKKRLFSPQERHIKECFILQRSNDDLLNIRHIDRILKVLGILPSKAQREEILRTKECVVGGKIAVCFSTKQIYIAPYVHETMTKLFKEACRKENIPHKIRPYLFSAGIQPSALRLDRIL